MTRHRFDPLSFVFGALFVAVATLGLIDWDLWTIADLRWIAPGALVLVGVLLLALSARRTDREPSATDPDDAADTAEDAPEGSEAAAATPGPEAADHGTVEAGPPDR